MKPTPCSICHAPIPANAPGGFCPACLLRDAEEPVPAGNTAPSLEEIAGAFLQFEILKLIGQGGMGFVYQVRQPGLDRTVALKILAPGLSRDPAFAERFAREARTLGKLNHPNIVTVFEHGESGGFFYLLMEYVDGVNLRQAMRAGRFTPEQALAIVPGICDALQAAHALGIWHRDIKPENILLDRDGKVKIADFGIARIVGDSEMNFTLTRTGGVLGSAAYMAPEQHENPRAVDHRADIYSLGVVIYEMLTGELPLGRFPAPSQRAAVNARIDEIVFRTLEKERELRQQSAEEVKTEVQGLGVAPMVSTEPLILKRRLRKAVVGLAALVLLSVLGIIIHFFRLKETRVNLGNYDYNWSEATFSDAESQILRWQLALSEMNEPKRNYAMGPVVEVVLPEPTSDAPFMLNFENGQLFSPNPDLGKLLKSGGSSYIAPQSMEDWSYTTESWYRWLQIQKVNVLAIMPDCDSIQFFATLTFPLTCKFEDADSDAVVRTIRERMDKNQPMETLVKHFKERSFIPLHSQFGQPFAFIAPETFGASIGMVEVVEKSAAPKRGVKIRYRLVNRMPDTPPRVGKPAERDPVTPEVETIVSWSIKLPADGQEKERTVEVNGPLGAGAISSDDYTSVTIRAGKSNWFPVCTILAKGANHGIQSQTDGKSLTGEAKMGKWRLSYSIHESDHVTLNSTEMDLNLGRVFVFRPDGSLRQVAIFRENHISANEQDDFAAGIPKEQPIGTNSQDSRKGEWRIDNASLITPREVDEEKDWAPWAQYFKDGDMRIARGDLDGALRSYQAAHAFVLKRQEKYPGTWLDEEAESLVRLGNVFSAMGDLPRALENYLGSEAILATALAKTPDDAAMRDELTRVWVKAGDIRQAQGDSSGALEAYQNGVAVAEKFEPNWQTEYPNGSQGDDLARNYQATETLRLIDQPERESWDLMWMIGQAGAIKDATLRPLLERKDLRDDATLALALAGYDFSLNGKQSGLDFILAALSRCKVGADVNEVCVLSFIDEWDRSIKAVNSHFLATDGAGGDCKNSFWGRRQLLFPRHYLEFRGKAGDGAPLPPEKPSIEETGKASELPPTQ